jgi:hypothetical protein
MLRSCRVRRCRASAASRRGPAAARRARPRPGSIAGGRSAPHSCCATAAAVRKSPGSTTKGLSKSTRGLLGEALLSSVVKLRRARALAHRHFSPVRSSAFSTGPSAYYPIERARPASGPSQGRLAPFSVMARWAVGQRRASVYHILRQHRGHTREDRCRSGLTPDQIRGRFCASSIPWTAQIRRPVRFEPRRPLEQPAGHRSPCPSLRRPCGMVCSTGPLSLACPP